MSGAGTKAEIMEDREGESCRGGAGGLLCGCFGGDDLGEDRGAGGALICGGFGDGVFVEDFLGECRSRPMFTHHVIQVDVAFA